MSEKRIRPGNRVVVCAANRSKVSGRIICGARHWDSLMRGMVVTDDNVVGLPQEWRGADQGFVDQFGVWMDRQEAWNVAKEAGQILDENIYSAGTLYSEDLY